MINTTSFVGIPDYVRCQEERKKLQQLPYGSNVFVTNLEEISYIFDYTLDIVIWTIS